MLHLLDHPFVTLAGIIVAFFATICGLILLKDKLPHDQGRAFAVDGTLSKGKARGAGIIFVIVYFLTSVLFGEISVQWMVYQVVIVLTMLTGYFDDASDKPWNEYLKGFLDLILAIVVSVTYLYFNGNVLNLGMWWDYSVTVPYFVYGLLIVILVWVSINVTNCSDGVDGLSATLSIVTLGSFLFIIKEESGINDSGYNIILFIIVLAAYLWFNANPSTMLMGDAGSRAMGMLIAIIALLSGRPVVYIPFAIVLILDGGLGLVKVALLRFLKIRILKNTRCPLHDHARKVLGWSNTQVCYRFTVIQVFVSMMIIWMFWMLG